MTKKNLMSLFKVSINRNYQDNLLTHLSALNTVHIKPRKKVEAKSKLEESDPIFNKIKQLRQNLDLLLRKLNLSENDFQNIKLKKEDRVIFTIKNLYELINHSLEEINFFLNRINELERYIARAKIELENINIIKESYIFLERFHLTRESIGIMEHFEFKVYTTFMKNKSNVDALFEFSEFPNVYQGTAISNDRIVFYIIYPVDMEDEFKDRIKIIHAEEVPILKKYLLPEGINFTRIVKEIDVIERTLLKYEREFQRLRENHLLTLAGIGEAIQNVEEYNWVERQFEESGPDKSMLKFYVPMGKKELVQNSLYKKFKGKIKIEIIDIIKSKEIYDTEEKTRIKDVKEPVEREGEGEDEEESREDLRENAPTIMKNRFGGPFESLTRMYGTPAYSEVDPTPFIAITFPLIFGLMFGDIGHGICLIISGLIGAKIFKNKSENMSNFFWIIFYCGWGAVLGGFIYGEYFGEHEMFGIHLTPLYANPLNDVMAVFWLAIIVGVIHLNLGWSIQFINYWKQHRKYFAISDSLLKILLLTGGTVLLIIWGFDINIWLASPFPILLPLLPGLLLVVSKPFGRAIGISYLQEESFGELISEGSMETFETLLSVMSNAASYIRLLALALAHIALMLSVKAMLGLVSKDAIGYNFIIVVGLIFGNLFIILLEGLLVFLNTIRLHFYEFFSKFFQGSGIEFFPFYLDDDYSVLNFLVTEDRDILSEEIEKVIDTKKSKEEIDKAIAYISDKFL